MQAPATPSPSLRSLTGHLSDGEFEYVLHPFHWFPIYLLALRVTIVQSANLLMPEISPRPLAYLELIERLLTSVGLSYNGDDARALTLRYITMACLRLDSRSGRDSVQPFIHGILDYLTEHVLYRTNRTTIWGYRRWEHNGNNLSLSYRGHSCEFNPSIAVARAGAPIFTVVTPSRRHGNPNCQLVGYLLAVAQKYFRCHPKRTVCEPCLIRMTDSLTDVSVYFARARVTREYLTNVEEEMVNEMERGFEVFISSAFDLGVVAERVRFVRSLASAYARVHEYEDREGHMPALGDLPPE